MTGPDASAIRRDPSSPEAVTDRAARRAPRFGESAAPGPYRSDYRIHLLAGAVLVIGMATIRSRVPRCRSSASHGCDSRADRVAVTVPDRRVVGSVQLTAADGRPRARGVARASLTDESRTAGDADVRLLLLPVAEIVPDDDIRLRDGRERCASPTTRGCRRKREKSLLAASYGCGPRSLMSIRRGSQT